MILTTLFFTLLAPAPVAFSPPLVADKAYWLRWANSGCAGNPAPVRTSGLARWGDSRYLASVRDSDSATPFFLVKTGEKMVGETCCQKHVENPVGPPLDLEGIAILPDGRFLAVSERDVWRLIYGRFDDDQALIETTWLLPCKKVEGLCSDSNRGPEGIAFDEDADGHGTAYLAFEGPENGNSRLVRFKLDLTAESQGDAFAGNDLSEFYSTTRPNPITGLELVSIKERSMLLALQRDDPYLLVFDLGAGDPELPRLACSIKLALLSPDGHKIDWTSPEGIAYLDLDDALYLVADPAVDNSRASRWKLEVPDPHSDESELFSNQVPLLWKIENVSEEFKFRGCMDALP